MVSVQLASHNTTDSAEVFYLQVFLLDDGTVRKSFWIYHEPFSSKSLAVPLDQLTIVISTIDRIVDWSRFEFLTSPPDISKTRTKFVIQNYDTP